MKLLTPYIIAEKSYAWLCLLCVQRVLFVLPCCAGLLLRSDAWFGSGFHPPISGRRSCSRGRRTSLRLLCSFSSIFFFARVCERTSCLQRREEGARKKERGRMAREVDLLIPPRGGFGSSGMIESTTCSPWVGGRGRAGLDRVVPKPHNAHPMFQRDCPFKNTLLALRVQLLLGRCC